MDENTSNVSFVKWHEIEEEIKSVNQGLFETISHLGFKDNALLVKISYPFGSNVLEKGEFQVPLDNGKVVPISHPEVPVKIKKNLSYNSIPLGVIVENGNEVYYDSDGKISSLAFFQPGTILGLWENMDEDESHFPRKIWNVSAGSRSMVMLPKISNNYNHAKVKNHFHIRAPAPKNFSAHAKVFSAIVNSGIKCGWKNTIIFFSKDWLFGRKKNDIDKFKYYLLKEAWQLSSYNRNEATWDIIWSRFNNYLKSNGIKGKPYYLYLVKHLVVASMGVIPAYRPSQKSTLAGPISIIQSSYIDVYGIKYMPIIMQPTHFSIDNIKSNSVYCSLQLPLLHSIFPKPLDKNTLLSDLKILHDTWELFVDAALEGELLIENTPIKNVIDNVQFQFIHTEDTHDKADMKTNDISHINDIIPQDPALTVLATKNNKNPPPTTSLFFRSCVRISPIYRKKD